MAKTYYFVFCKEDLLLEKTADGGYTIPSQEEPPTEVKPWTHQMDITPMADSSPVITYRIDNPITDSDRFEMIGLRQSYYKLSRPLYLKAGKCQELLYWDQNTKYCGVCGAPMRMDTDISKKCTQCGKEIWPQLATAVIVLIHKGDEVLLVRAKNFRRDFFGLVAGFVETGETLEEAVAREALEETGVKITNIRYFASQPWPYPCGLMVGFNADYVSGEIHLQKSEIAKGGWFRRDNLPEIPEKLSIARMLLDDRLLASKGYLRVNHIATGSIRFAERGIEVQAIGINMIEVHRSEYCFIQETFRHQFTILLFLEVAGEDLA